MKKLDFAEYVRLTDHIHERDGMRHLNASAVMTQSGKEFLAIIVLDRQTFGDEPITGIVSRLCGRSILKNLKIKNVDEKRNAVEFVFKDVEVEK